MKKYFIHDGNEQLGPYDLNELQVKKITKETQIWYEGLESWTKAENVEELKDIFKSVPPPFTQKQTPPPINQTTKISPVSKKRNVLKPILIVVGSVIGLVILLSVVGAVVESSESSSQQESYQEKIMTVEEIERATPTDFLSASGKYSENFWGDKIILNAEITSTATVATFKDVIVRVKFFSKTQTELGSEDFTIYELIQPHSTVKFDLKVNNYKDVSTLGLEVISAVPN